MRLSDQDIVAFLEKKQIIIEPQPDRSAISGISIDLTLGNSFRVFNDHQAPFVDLSAPKPELAATLENVMSQEICLAQGDAFFLHPGELALAVTAESVTLPDNLVGWLDGRSSLARLGLMVHITAHRIDPGWSGQIVLEFINAGKLPLALRPGMVIAAINFEMMTTAAKKPYNRRANAKYQNQSSALGSRISQEGKSE